MLCEQNTLQLERNVESAAMYNTKIGTKETVTC